MLPVSQAYKDAVLGTTDDANFRASFEFIPAGAKENATATASATTGGTAPASVNDDVETMGAKWGSLEGRGDNARVDLTGTYTFPSENETKELGLWLDALCAEDGTFTVGAEPWILYTLNTDYALIGTTVLFDDKGSEWPVRLRVEYLNSSNGVIASAEFDNNGATGLFDLTGNSVRKVKFTFLQWNKGARHAKIVEVFPGQRYAFDGTNAFNFELREEFTPFSGAGWAEGHIQFSNADAEFDIVNPSGLASYLRQQMQFKCSMDVAGETISVGDWVLDTWQTESSIDTGFFTLRPLMAISTEFYPFDEDAPTGTQTVTQACAEIFGPLPYNIEDGLGSLTVNRQIGASVYKRDAMSYLAIAVGGYWRFERDGSYTLRKVEIETPVRAATYSQLWDRPNIKQTEFVTGVKCKYYFWRGLGYYGTDGYELASNEAISGDETGVVKTVDSVFIPTMARAQAIADQALAWYQNRVDVSGSIKGDAALQSGDTITVHHDYGDVDIFATSLVTTWSRDIIETRIQGVG